MESAGIPLTRQTRDGVYTYAYDALDQLLAETLPPNAFGAGRTSWSYDPARRRTLEVSPFGRTTSTYDAADQLLTERTGGRPPVGQYWLTVGAYPWLYQHPWWRGHPFLSAGGTLTTYSYDASGNRTRRQTPWAATTYAWDPGQSKEPEAGGRARKQRSWARIVVGVGTDDPLGWPPRRT